jgi:hypothetical protein
VRRFLLISCLLLGTATASARTREQFAFRVHLGSGRVQAIALPKESSGPPRRRWFSIFRHGDGPLVLTELREGKPNRDVFQVEPPSASGAVAWQSAHENGLMFVWRSFAPNTDGAGDRRLEWLGYFDLASQRVSWWRELTDRTSYPAMPLGQRVMLLPLSTTLEVVSLETGQALRRQPKHGNAVGGWPVENGAAIVSDGNSLELLELASLTTLWRVPIAGVYRGALAVDDAGSCARPVSAEQSPRPLPRDIDWLVYGDGVLARIEPKTGKVRYEVQSRSFDVPCIFQGRIYEPELQSTVASVTARDLSDGAVLRRYHVQSYGYADERYVRVTRAGKQHLVVTTDFRTLE